MKRPKNIALSLVVIFFLNALIIGLAQSGERASAAVYRQGSRGETVKQIQRVLSNNGYYSGSIDGIYGEKTTAAVKKYQRAAIALPDNIHNCAHMA